MHLFSLTEDTFFLALEDAHKRKLNIQGQQKLADSKKVKFFTYSTDKENMEKQKKLSNKYQIKQLIRNGIKTNKASKKRFYNHPIIKDSKASDNEKHEAFKYAKSLAIENNKKNVQNGGIAAGYNPLNKTIGINKNAIKNNMVTKKPMTKLEIHKTLSHELEHKSQFDKIKQKYGNTGVRQVLSKTSMNAAKQSVANGKKTELWHTLHNPLEKGAYKVGGETNSLRDRRFGKDKSFNPKAIVNPHLFKKAQKNTEVDRNHIIKQFDERK